MLFSPERTSCFSFSLFESNIFFPLEYVSVDTPAVSANLARTSILLIAFEEFCEGFSLIGFTNFGKGDLSQSTSTNFGVPDSIRLTEFYLKVSPFGEPFYSFW